MLQVGGECSPTLPNVAQLGSGKEGQSGGIGFLSYAERCTELVAAEGRPQEVLGLRPVSSVPALARSICVRSLLKAFGTSFLSVFIKIR